MSYTVDNHKKYKKVGEPSRTESNQKSIINKPRYANQINVLILLVHFSFVSM